jgi:hypothetical protein
MERILFAAYCCFSTDFHCTYSSINSFDICFTAPISNRTDILPHEEIPKTMSPKDDALKLASRNQNPNFRDEGPSSNNHNVTPAAPAGKIMAAGGRKKYLMKFLCFMSF